MPEEDNFVEVDAGEVGGAGVMDVAVALSANREALHATVAFVIDLK